MRRADDLREPRPRPLDRHAHSAASTATPKPWEDRTTPAVKRQLGEWTVTVEGWEDAYVSWLHDATHQGAVWCDDVDNALDFRLPSCSPAGPKPPATPSLTARRAQDAWRPPPRPWPTPTLSPAGTSRRRRQAATVSRPARHSNPLRDGLSPSAAAALQGGTPESPASPHRYQFFPRSEGAVYHRSEHRQDQAGHAGHRTLAKPGTRRSQEGFDIVYLPPVFPIGVTNRKGRNNTLVAGPDTTPAPRDGIGSELGGHVPRRPAARHHGRFQGPVPACT